ncbi:MAG: hypothetical protein U0228_01690 [Myxococcaceae bacterium]
MLGSISWDEVGLLALAMFGVEYGDDELAWEPDRGDHQLARVPDEFTKALAALADVRVVDVANAWHVLLVERAGWKPGPHTLVAELEGLRAEARKARGALWLRIQP